MERYTAYERTGLTPEEISTLKAERDAAESDIKTAARLHNDFGDDCKLFCKNAGIQCSVCVDMCHWKWRGL